MFGQMSLADIYLMVAINKLLEEFWFRLPIRNGRVDLGGWFPASF